MSEPFIGEIRCVGFNYAPDGWLQCNGQTLNVSSNAVLFSLLSNTYGGNGTTTFAIPNLNNKLPIGGISSYGKKTIYDIPSPNIPANAIQIILDNP
jgi:microcystin-dependent protein